MPINLEAIDCPSIVPNQTNENLSKEKSYACTQPALDKASNLPAPLSFQSALDKTSTIHRVNTVPALDKTSTIQRVNTLPALDKTSNLSTQGCDAPFLFVPIKSKTKLQSTNKTKPKQNQLGEYRPLEYSIEEMLQFADKDTFPERIFIIGNEPYTLLYNF